ncbi:MAG: hypothetical protein D6689_01915 [Deltaproteobacteria bacterium]|nr:MAG: hypothetical protein D6689_01915 [Deltaproteobacteria bacterium]
MSTVGYLPPADLFGWWLAIFLTIAILSFLYKDNPVYKFAEHLFIGVSIGYVVTQQIYNTVLPKLVQQIGDGKWWYWFAVLLGLLLLSKAVSRRHAWLARFPIAFVVAFYAGIQVNGVLQGDFGPQLVAGMRPVVVDKVNINTAPPEEIDAVEGMPTRLVEKIVARRAERPFTSVDEALALADSADEQVELAAGDGPLGGRLAGTRARLGTDDGPYWFGTFSLALMLAGLIASLVYFYFSIEHKGVVGKVSRFGVWILMLGFGAAFGATVQGRLALAVGRATDVLGHNKPPEVAAQIGGPYVALASIAAIVAILVVWERARRRRGGAAGDAG